MQGYKCKACGKSFQLKFEKKAYQQGIREQIIAMSLNGSGTRDIARVLGIDKNTVTARLKKIETQAVNPYVIDKQEAHRLALLGEIICLAVSIDEQWSYVKSKANQRWLWYALEKRSGKVLAFVFGKRSDEAFLQLKVLLSGFNIGRYYSDEWGSYHRNLWDFEHQVGKRYTQDIERKNLDLSTRIKRLQRKTICFSNSEHIHDKLIGLFINRFMF